MACKRLMGREPLSMTKLDESSRKVLRVIFNRGPVRGRDIIRIAGLDAGQLRQAINRLATGSLVTTHAGGIGVESDQDAREAMVSILPSRKSEAEFELRQGV